MPKAQREGKIYVNYLRNGYNAIAIAAYSIGRYSIFCETEF